MTYTKAAGNRSAAFNIFHPFASGKEIMYNNVGIQMPL